MTRKCWPQVYNLHLFAHLNNHKVENLNFISCKVVKIDKLFLCSTCLMGQNLFSNVIHKFCIIILLGMGTLWLESAFPNAYVHQVLLLLDALQRLQKLHNNYTDLTMNFDNGDTSDRISVTYYIRILSLLT